jgi:hypothetical protein
LFQVEDFLSNPSFLQKPFGIYLAIPFENHEIIDPKSTIMGATIDAQDLADRTVAVFEEADPQKRAKDIASLWTPDGEHFGGFQARGYPDLERGIAGSYENQVVKRGLRWRAYNAQLRDNIVFFMFDGVSSGTGEVIAFGSYVLVLSEDGKIQKDYTFVMQSRFAPGDDSGRP